MPIGRCSCDLQSDFYGYRVEPAIYLRAVNITALLVLVKRFSAKMEYVGG
jgi:hypothetical protein